MGYDEVFETDVTLPAEEPALMDDDTDGEILPLVVSMLEEAEQFYTGDVEPVQANATQYYLGEKFGNEVKGRSQVVSTDVRDTIQAILPSFMRIIFGPEQIVEFAPEHEEDIEPSAQQTEYVNYIIRKDNPGFMIMHSWIKDAFVRKIGIVKWNYVERNRIVTSSHTGISEEQLALLSDEGHVEILKEYPNIAATSDPQQPLTLYDVKLTRKADKNRFVIENVPNDEFFVSPSARSLADARLVAHVREMKAHELIEMGIDPEIVEKAKGHVDRVAHQLANARAIDGGANTSDDEEQDETTRPVEYAECYVLLEGPEGSTQLRKVCIVGRSEIVFDEAVEERPFAVYCPDPEPHTLYGQSIADYTMDLQLMKSMIMRGMLDSLNLTLNPRTEIVDGYVSVADLLNPEIGGLVRARAPGMMREIKHDFVGREALPVLAYMDEIKENRTGIAKAAAGLDADALQSSTKAAVAATITGAQQHIELLVRIFAETGLKQLFSGLLRAVVRHQDYARVVRLRNEWVPVDPRSWDAEKDVQVNVALGAGTSEEKLRTLQTIVESQMALLQMPGQPLVGFAELRGSLGKMAELSGWPRSSEFYKPFTAAEEAQMKEQQAQQAEQQPQDPTVMALQMQLQIEQQKAQIQAQAESAKHQREMQKLQLEDERERDRMAREFALKQQELEMKYGIQAATNEAMARTERERMIMDANNAREQAQAQAQQAMTPQE